MKTQDEHHHTMQNARLCRVDERTTSTCGRTDGRDEEDDTHNEGRTTHIEDKAVRGEGKEEAKEETTVLAWWKAYGSGHKRMGGVKTHEHVYSTTLQPSTPLEPGTRVRLVALTKNRKTMRGATLDHYQPYEPHVVGRVAKISGEEEGWTRVTILNECRGNDVAKVELEIPHVPGVTIRDGLLDETELTGGPRPTMELPRGGGSTWQYKPSCEAGRCDLEGMKEHGRRTMRARPAKGKGEGYDDLRATGEGTFAIHLWMRYDYAR